MSLRMSIETVDADIDALLEGIRSRYGYDFTHYARASLKRRIERAREKAGLPDYAALLDLIVKDENSFDDFLRTISITVTEMFRDPLFYKAVRAQIVPMLKTFPYVKIWHAGCATGEEVYSMAVLLHEEGFLDRVQIYATDFNKDALDKARQGIYPFKNIANGAGNYLVAGGKTDFLRYFSSSYELAKIHDYLRERVTFSYHNLVTDGVFGEMNLICCRNVLIYFDRQLQDLVLRKLAASLRHSGFLCLGTKETLNFTAIRPQFETLDAAQRIYCKTGGEHAISAV